MKYVVFMCCTLNVSISNWPRMDGKIQPAITHREDSCFDVSRDGHALVTLYVHFLCSDWSKFDRWVHAEISCSILKLVYFDSWSWLSFTFCDVFNCLFPLDVQNETQILSRVFCYSWLVCLLGFCWEIRRPSKPEIRFRIVFVFHLAWLQGWKVKSDSDLTW